MIGYAADDVAKPDFRIDVVKARGLDERRQLVIAFEAPQLWMMQPPERQRIVSSLANLLLQAAGDDPLEEDGDDGR